MTKKKVNENVFLVTFCTHTTQSTIVGRMNKIRQYQKLVDILIKFSTLSSAGLIKQLVKKEIVIIPFFIELFSIFPWCVGWIGMEMRIEVLEYLY